MFLSRRKKTNQNSTNYKSQSILIHFWESTQTPINDRIHHRNQRSLCTRKCLALVRDRNDNGTPQWLMTRFEYIRKEIWSRCHSIIRCWSVLHTSRFHYVHHDSQIWYVYDVIAVCSEPTEEIALPFSWSWAQAHSAHALSRRALCTREIIMKLIRYCRLHFAMDIERECGILWVPCMIRAD